MELIQEITLHDPPTYYDIPKVRASKAAGKEMKTRHYLTANLFTNSNISYFITDRIKTDCKLLIEHNIDNLPKLEKMHLEIVVKRMKHIDLDNVAYFWKKLFMDVLKTPSEKQIANAKAKNRVITSTNTIPDDSTKYIDSFTEKFEIGESAIIFRIFGRLAENQTTMKLF